GMKAVTIRVNDVEGVAGFVLPGDHVDVALTRQIDKDNGSTQVVLQDVRVLAVDQVADERVSNPAVAKSVTLEGDTVGAQKLGLAGSIGTLSLLLRKAGETSSEKPLRVTLKDLFSEMVSDVGRGSSTTVMITRGSSKGTVKEGYSVPIETENALATAGGRARKRLLHGGERGAKGGRGWDGARGGVAGAAGGESGGGGRKRGGGGGGGRARGAR